MNIKALLIEDTNKTSVQFFRSLFVGGIATLADMGVLIFLRELFHISEDIAAVFGFVVGLVVNYLISSLWVFAKAKVKNRALDFIVFGVIGVIGLVLTQLIIAPFATNGIFGTGLLVEQQILGSLLPPDKYYIIGKMLAVVLVYMWNFFARKFLLYNKNENDIPEAETDISEETRKE